MRQILVVLLAVVALSFVAAPAQAQTAIYDYETGIFTFDGLSGQAGITLVGNGITFDAGAMNGFGQINDSALAGADPAKLAWSNFGGFQGGPFTSGPVVPPKTDPELFSVELTSIGAPADVLPRMEEWDNLPASSDRGRGYWAVNIPEPGTVALAGLGLIGLGLVRRRRG